jgi:hypothetical protein
MVWVEVLRAAYVEESAPGVPVREKMVEEPSLSGAARANVSPRADGGPANGVEPQPKDAPGRAALTLGTLKGPGFSLSQEATLDDVMFVPGSFDIVDLGTEESRLLGYPLVPLLPASWGKMVGVQS